MASWMGPDGRDGALDLIRQRLDDENLEDPTPRIIRRFLEEKLGLKELELDADECKQQVKEMINEVIQEEDERGSPPKKSAAKSSKSKTREPKEVKASMPKSSPLYTNLRKLCQVAGLNPNKLVNSQMYLPEKVSALKKALIDAGFKNEQLKSDAILETIEVAEASRFAKENEDETFPPRGRRRAAAAVDYKAIYAKEIAGIEGVDSGVESEEDAEEEEVGSEEEEDFSVNGSAEEDASDASESASEDESEEQEKPRKRSTRNKPRATGRGRPRRRKQVSSDEDEEEDEVEEELEEEVEEDEGEEEMSEEESQESAPKKKKLKKN